MHLPVVARGQQTGLVGPVDKVAAAKAGVTFVAGRGADSSHVIAQHRPDLLIRLLTLFIPAHGDGLELFSPHHRAHAGAAGGVARAGHDAGVAHAVFAAWPDEHEPGAFAQFVAERFRRRAGIQAPKVSRVSEFCAVTVNPQRHRTPGAAFDEQGLDSSGAQFGSKVAADVGTAQQAGQRRESADVQPGRDRRFGAGE